MGLRRVTILLIEDSNGLGAAIAQALGDAHFQVDWRRSLAVSYPLASDPGVDLILLDRGLPDGEGIDFLRRLRAEGVNTPVMVISERTSVPDRVAGLDAGADDYLIKPFAFAELVARCRALMRRPRDIEMEPVVFGRLVLRPDTLELAVHGEALNISRREGQLLVALLRRPGRVCTRTYLENALYEPSAAVSPNALETSISRLRSQLQRVSANVEITTVRGVGYALKESGVG
jgi:DNA-binding response OmpR family regulator